ncbi:MAG: ABC transporter substrate-binding protein [Pseudomonadota bacterium]|nr:ABC transporter substrate-binding protein [Pseudomonadota bacterium]
MNLFLFGASLLISCGQKENSLDQNFDNTKTFHFSLASAPTSLDPVRSSTLYANYIVENLFDTLYSYKFLKRPFELRPALAASMPIISDDGLTYKIPLKRNMFFADDPSFTDGKGREVIASDVIFSILRHFDPETRPSGTWLWQDRIIGLDAWKASGSDYNQEVPGLRALDNYTIEIRLLKPYPQLLYTLAMGYSGVVPREAIEYYGREFSINPVGSGPFRLVSFDSTKAVLVSNENFRQQVFDLKDEGYDPLTQGGYGLEFIDGRVPPFIDRLEISFIKESSAQWSSFTKGNEIQFTGLPNEQVDRVLKSKNPISLKKEFTDLYHFRSWMEAGFVYSVFNMDFPEIGYNDNPDLNRRNKALRCAMIRGFDWQSRNESWYSGLGEIFPGIIPPMVPEFDPNLSMESTFYDPESARRLLEENGWNSETLPILEYGAMPGPTSRLFFEQFRAWMKRIGYPTEKLKLKTYATFGDIVKAWRNSELPYISKGWGLDYPDAENTLQLFYGPNGSPGSNDGNYKNPKYDELYRSASVMLPSPERTAIYREMNELLIKDCIAVSGLARVGVSMWHKNVIFFPERYFIGGRALMYVDLVD